MQPLWCRHLPVRLRHRFMGSAPLRLMRFIFAPVQRLVIPTVLCILLFGCGLQLVWCRLELRWPWLQ